MAELPFEISVKTIKPHQAAESLRCSKLLREVPKKRYVYKATWNGKNVIAKIFEGLGARLRLKKEWNGLQELLRRKLDAPTPCFYGTTNNDSQVLVTLEITGALAAVDIFQNDTNQINRQNFLSLIVKELAKLHNNGVLQKDIHLGNFLISGKNVYTLDAGQMVYLSKPLNLNASIRQLAAILCYCPEYESRRILFSEYAKIRNWNLIHLNEITLNKYIDKYLKKAIMKALKKTTRTSKNYVKIQKNGFKGVFDRKFFEQTETATLFEQIDILMDKGEILKRGNTCYVSRISWVNRDLVVKRYNNKGFLHSVRNTLKGSRANRCWLYGHLLRMLKIPTPQPLCFFEKYKGLAVWQSYIITEFTKGQKLSEILTQQNNLEDDRQRLKNQITKAVDKMHNNKITHGDLKHSNIIINDEQVVFTDLDGMKKHWLKTLCARRSKKDMNSLAKIE